MKSLSIPDIRITDRFKHADTVIFMTLSGSAFNFILAIIGAVLRIKGFQSFSGGMEVGVGGGCRPL